MNEPLTPPFCSRLNDQWPFFHALPEALLISTHFDPAQLADIDFQRSGVPPVRGVAKRQAEHLAGRLCAREALRRVTGIASVPAVGADRAPQWPAGVSGSITHSHGWAAAIVAPRGRWRGLGLDAEQPLNSARAEGLAAEILTAQELQRLAGLSDEQRALRISLTFSLKESLFKALYPLVLKHFYFHDAELLALDPAAGTARLRLLVDLAADWPAGSQLDGVHTRVDSHLLSLVAIAA
ncbi:enterobactin synthetase component D [Pseudomonas flavescens]|uniref:Enterobactin synthase component D n=2 Tax=Phytopseudomonas flavescens TaxID=29435 RepID=A0A1G7XUR2_9GAMM|nr:4'-phosphopantetheinyl transferase superfamily protein [Pseudomonas flavescens]SDG87891.1 enterobactin synthetase component D [Pseudomonas flavescens]